MNKIKFILLFVLSVIFLLPVGCKKTQEQPAEQKPSTNTTASIGMQAPQLSIAQWVKGKPVDIAAGKGKKIFVVEFWATWCPPCKVTIPHLTEIQKKYANKDVVIVGITDEEVKLVKDFVSSMGDKMDYVVAVDDNSKTSKSYLESFGVETIPHAFIIDKSGRIVWQGNPMEGFDEALEQVVNGNFSIEKEIKKGIADKKFREFIEAVDKDDTNKVQQIGKELEQIDNEVGGLVKDKKFKTDEMYKLVRFSMLMNEYRNGIMSGKTEAETDAIAKKAEQFTPPELNFAELISNLKLQKTAMDYFQMVVKGDDEAKIAELAKTISETKSTNSVLLSQIAWAMMTNEKVNKKDMPLALKLAKAAYDNSSKDEDIVQVYAKALFENGQKEEAIKYQKVAIELCQDKEKKDEFQKALEEYQKK